MDPAATRTQSLPLSFCLSICLSRLASHLLRSKSTFHLTNASPLNLPRHTYLGGPYFGDPSAPRLPPHSPTGHRRRIEGTRIRIAEMDSGRCRRKSRPEWLILG
ncbi:hypothetical protein BDW42DRAFT_177674 [Aspergillus taichungensis]|uniref:Uncharacterized protein n=1 Tax=Aspergillus taichungensis TaxID=482145 RepID=A0A2J5HIX4_9EURO|nr:hypothetical protein BDW42DRAFT_177674 [Aspergillus taichungensis]